MRRDLWRDSCPDFPGLMSRLSRLKLPARLGSLGLNPDAARPLARLMSRLSRPDVQTFQTQTLGATMQFGSKSGCGATLGATHVQTFQTQTPGATRQFGSKSGCGATIGATHIQTFQTWCPDFPDWDSRRYYSIWVWTRMRRDHGGYGATFETKAEYERFSRPRRRRRGFPVQVGECDQSGGGAAFQTKAGSALISKHSRTRRIFPDQGRDAETKKQFLVGYGEIFLNFE